MKYFFLLFRQIKVDSWLSITTMVILIGSIDHFFCRATNRISAIVRPGYIISSPSNLSHASPSHPPSLLAFLLPHIPPSFLASLLPHASLKLTLPPSQSCPSYRIVVAPFFSPSPNLPCRSPIYSVNSTLVSPLTLL